MSKGVSMGKALSADLKWRVAEAEAKVGADGRWRQHLHLMPPVGWLNDPNGLCQVGERYHAFFQYAPFDACGGLKMWGHCESRDLVSWDYVGVPLVPDQSFDAQGVYSGSAVVEDGLMSVLYTGNVKLEGEGLDYVDAGREANVVLVQSADGGRSFGPKHLVMTNADYPSDCTLHVRDPKVWRDGGRYLMVLGARRRAAAGTLLRESPYSALHGERAGVDVGELLAFESADLRTWLFVRRLSSTERFGFMWECPDYFELACGDAPARVLSVCPQGLEGSERDGQNVYQSGYFLLDKPLLEAASPDPAGFRLWDAGFDFYAPQSFEAADGRRILIGWMGMPDEPAHVNPTVALGWQHCLAIPRELAATDGAILQRPVRELERYRSEGVAASGLLERQGSEAFDLEVEGIRDRLSIELAGGLRIVWDAETAMLELGFEVVDGASSGFGRRARRVRLEQLRNLCVVGDASSVELFANNGVLVMSTRYYPDEYCLSVTAPGADIRCWDLSWGEERLWQKK